MNATRLETPGERLRALCMLVLCPILLIVLFVIVELDMAPGIAAGHPKEYLQGTCIATALITLILPILSLKNVIVLPNWFLALVYFDLYMYATTLCLGMYFTISWWGDLSHVISSAVVSEIVFMALCVMAKYSPGHVSIGSRGGIAITLFVVSVSFGGIWELIECSTDWIAGNSYMVYGADMSLADVTADAIGAGIVALYAYFSLKDNSPEDMVRDLKVRIRRPVAGPSGSGKGL